MKIKLFAILCAAIFVTDVSAEMNQKKKKIKTVEDVKEFRSHRIVMMTEKLDSGELNPKQKRMIKERISALSTKPLPTQEQIDWAIKNKDLKKMMRNYRKGMKKPMGNRRGNVIG
ncbi:MAG: hypothetical protein ACJ0FF_01905 [Gammaproteobacteria bacterium]